MKTKDKVDILVVGAGPVGMMTALLLARRDVHVRIVDRDPGVGTHSYGLALHPSTLRLLERMDLLERAQSEGLVLTGISLYDDQGPRVELPLSEGEGGPGHMLVIPQDRLERMLESALEEAGVQVDWNHCLTSCEQNQEGASAVIDVLEQSSVGYAVSRIDWFVARSYRQPCQFLVGADGHNSVVRRQLQIGFERTAPTKHFLVFEAATPDMPSELKIVYHDETVNAMWPLPGSRIRWSFEMKDETAPYYSRVKEVERFDLPSQARKENDKQNLIRILSERAPWFNSPISEVFWTMPVRFEQRFADGFGRDRIWMAGDAIHMGSPLGVHSLNRGLLEAEVLAQALETALGNGTQGQRELLQYEGTAHREWENLIHLPSLASPKETTDPWVAEHAGSLVGCLPATGAQLQMLLRQLELRA